MRWSEDGFNHLLHLRLAWVNDRFDNLFSVSVSPSPNRAYAPAGGDGLWRIVLSLISKLTPYWIWSHKQL